MVPELETLQLKDNTKSSLLSMLPLDSCSCKKQMSWVLISCHSTQ